MISKDTVDTQGGLNCCYLVGLYHFRIVVRTVVVTDRQTERHRTPAAMTTLQCPALFRGTPWIAERRSPGPIIVLHYQQLLPLLIPRVVAAAELALSV